MLTIYHVYLVKYSNSIYYFISVKDWCGKYSNKTTTWYLNTMFISIIVKSIMTYQMQLIFKMAVFNQVNSVYMHFIERRIAYKNYVLKWFYIVWQWWFDKSYEKTKQKVAMTETQDLLYIFVWDSIYIPTHTLKDHLLQCIRTPWLLSYIGAS